MKFPVPTIALLILLVPGYAAGQGIGQLSASFERDVNRMRWSSTLFADVLGPEWEVSALNRFDSEALTFGTFTNFRDENRAQWRVQRVFSDHIFTTGRGHFTTYSQGEVLSGEMVGGARYRFEENLWIEPVLGAAWDRRPGAVTAAGTYDLRSDAGLAFGFRGEAQPYVAEDYLLSVNADAMWHRIDPRRGRAARTGAVVEGQIENVAIRIDGIFASMRRDAYQSASFLNRDVPRDVAFETVEATMTDTLLARGQVAVPLQSGLQAQANLSFLSSARRIRTLRAPADALYFDTNLGRTAVNGETAVEYGRADRMVRLAVTAGAEVERRTLENRAMLPPVQAAQRAALLRQADFDRGHFALRATARYPFLERFVFSFNGNASILRHDTPETNSDDRDEAFHTLQTGILWQANRYFQADLRVFASYYHTVYLSGQRSAENNKQRSLRLRPGVRWTPSAHTRLEVTSEVRATYTVDDFQLEGRRPNDQSARELRYDARFEQQLGRFDRLMVQGGFSDLHLGRLLWPQFSEIPFDTLRTYNGWIRFQTGSRAVAEIGLRAFIRTDFDRAVTVRYPRLDPDGNPLFDETGRPLTELISRPGREWIEQAGPTCSIDWPLTEGSRMRFDGWLQIQRIRQDLYGELPERYDEVIRRAGRRGQIRTIPNMTLSVVWSF